MYYRTETGDSAPIIKLMSRIPQKNISVLKFNVKKFQKAVAVVT